MKTRILSSVLSILFAACAYAQGPDLQLGFNYAFTNPTGGMKQHIRFGNGAVMNAYWTAPSQRVSFGFEMNWSQYGSDLSEQEYEFPDGTVAPMNIRVNNGFTNYMGTVRLYLLSKGLVRPYAELKGGYSSFATKLLVLDPDDTDSCEPVDSEVLKREGTMVYSAGGGVRIDLATMSKRAIPGRAFLDLSVNATQGGRVDYMNTDAPQPGPQHNSSRANDVEAEFINTQTQVTHRHHVGYVYSSFVQATDMRIGLLFTMGSVRPSAQ